MSGNTESVQGENTERGCARWPVIPADCDPVIAKAVNTFLASLYVSDALLCISRTIGDRRRRAKKQSSNLTCLTWWPELNRRLIDEHLTPLLDDLQAGRRTVGDAVPHLLRESKSYLTQSQPRLELPRYKMAARLADEYLQPVLETLPDTHCYGTLESGAWSDGAALVRKISTWTFREWFECHGRAHYLEEDLEYLVLGEYCTEDYVDGRYRNLFEVAEDFWNEFQRDDDQLNVTWNQSGIEAILFVVRVMRQRIEAKQAKQDEEQKPQPYFCELCDALTQRTSNEHDPKKIDTGSARFCKDHDPNENPSRYKKDAQKKLDFDLMVSCVLGEARRDPDYGRRLLDAADANWTKVVEHTCSCIFCGGHPLEPACFDRAREYFPSLIAFHANARKVAYQLAHSFHWGRANLIDDAVQRREDAKEAARHCGLNTDKAAGQHSELALVRLLHQKEKRSEIARRLGTSSSAVSQRIADLNGSWDFALERCDYLRWWPFDDIAGPDIARFPSRSLGSNWRHSSKEYQHLVRTRRKPSKGH